MKKFLLIFCIIMAPKLGFAADKDIKMVEPEKIKPGMWASEDCIKLSKASGLYLKISSDLLKDSGEKRENGNNRRADELGSASLFFSNLAANYATNFQAYCLE